MMKKTYIVPELEIESLVVDDIVMISGVSVKESGSLSEIGWDDLT